MNAERGARGLGGSSRAGKDHGYNTHLKVLYSILLYWTDSLARRPGGRERSLAGVAGAPSGASAGRIARCHRGARAPSRQAPRGQGHPPRWAAAARRAAAATAAALRAAAGPGPEAAPWAAEAGGASGAAASGVTARRAARRAVRRAARRAARQAARPWARRQAAEAAEARRRPEARTRRAAPCGPPPGPRRPRPRQTRRRLRRQTRWSESWKRTRVADAVADALAVAMADAGGGASRGVGAEAEAEAEASPGPRGDERSPRSGEERGDGAAAAPRALPRTVGERGGLSGSGATLKLRLEPQTWGKKAATRIVGRLSGRRASSCGGGALRGGATRALGATRRAGWAGISIPGWKGPFHQPQTELARREPRCRSCAPGRRVAVRVWRRLRRGEGGRAGDAGSGSGRRPIAGRRAQRARRARGRAGLRGGTRLGGGAEVLLFEGRCDVGRTELAVAALVSRVEEGEAGSGEVGASRGGEWGGGEGGGEGGVGGGRGGSRGAAAASLSSTSPASLSTTNSCPARRRRVLVEPGANTTA